MKTKLLSKIKERFGYYFNSNGFPCLIDHRLKTLVTIDEDYLCRYYSYKDIENMKASISVTTKELAWRNCRKQMYQPFGYNMNNVWYNIANRRSRVKKRENMHLT